MIDLEKIRQAAEAGLNHQYSARGIALTIEGGEIDTLKGIYRAIIELVDRICELESIVASYQDGGEQ